MIINIVLNNNSKLISCEMILILPINEYLLHPERLESVRNNILIEENIVGNIIEKLMLTIKKG